LWLHPYWRLITLPTFVTNRTRTRLTLGSVPSRNHFGTHIRICCSCSCRFCLYSRSRSCFCLCFLRFLAHAADLIALGVSRSGLIHFLLLLSCFFLFLSLIFLGPFFCFWSLSRLLLLFCALTLVPVLALVPLVR
jgi:hypothetical protein